MRGGFNANEDRPKVCGTPGMEDLNEVKAKRVEIGTTRIEGSSFFLRKKLFTVMARRTKVTHPVSSISDINVGV